MFFTSEFSFFGNACSGMPRKFRGVSVMALTVSWTQSPSVVFDVFSEDLVVGVVFGLSVNCTLFGVLGDGIVFK